MGRAHIGSQALCFYPTIVSPQLKGIQAVTRLIEITLDDAAANTTDDHFLAEGLEQLFIESPTPWPRRAGWKSIHGSNREGSRTNEMSCHHSPASFTFSMRPGDGQFL